MSVDRLDMVDSISCIDSIWWTNLGELLVLDGGLVVTQDGEVVDGVDVEEREVDLLLVVQERVHDRGRAAADDVAVGCMDDRGVD